MTKANKTKTTGPRQTYSGHKNRLFTYAIIFIFGFLAGIVFSVYRGELPAHTTSHTTGDQAPPSDDGTLRAIANLTIELTANPEDYQSWIRLGHLYYDSNQPEKAIAAYTKSLEFHAGDANLLTDLGVMYRQTNQPERAIDLFDRAIKKDPNHLFSRYNKGIVLLNDLDEPQKAIACWEELIKIAPHATTAEGTLVSSFVEEIKTELDKRK